MAWHHALSTGSFPCPARTTSTTIEPCFRKLALVDLQDRPVKLITEKGNKAVFTQVFLDFDELDPVKANPIAPGFDALDRALNQVRAQLDQSPIDPEWRTPQTTEDYSQTASQVIDCESSPVE